LLHNFRLTDVHWAGVDGGTAYFPEECAICPTRTANGMASAS
jgi:hypothetical protein